MFKSTKHVSPQRPHPKSTFSVRVGRIPSHITDEQIKAAFSPFGNVVGVRRPINLAKKQPSQFAWVIFDSRESVELSIAQMDGFEIWETHLSAGDGDVQDSFFTQDTGFITNEVFDVPKAPPADFDPTLPETHFHVKHKEALKYKDNFFSVRVDDLHPDITKEMLTELFSSVGEVANIYFPVDLKHGCKSRGFAFVRFLTQSECDRAIREFDGVYLGIGRNISVRRTESHTYFSQDETVPFKAKNSSNHSSYQT